MSKAFTKDDASEAELLVIPRAPLSEGMPNYVTPRGLRLLRLEQATLDQERAALHAQSPSDAPARLHALAQRAAELQARVSSAELVEPPAVPHAEVRFGAAIRVRHESGKESEYRIVGVDEADAACGRLAFSSPLARALLGKRAGEVIEVRTPRSTEELSLLAVRYAAEAGE